MVYICTPNFGRLTQLVQSASLTRRKSGVRVPHRPHHSKVIPCISIIYKGFLFIVVGMVVGLLMTIHLFYFKVFLKTTITKNRK